MLFSNFWCTQVHAQWRRHSPPKYVYRPARPGCLNVRAHIWHKRPCSHPQVDFSSPERAADSMHDPADQETIHPASASKMSEYIRIPLVLWLDDIFVTLLLCTGFHYLTWVNGTLLGCQTDVWCRTDGQYFQTASLVNWCYRMKRSFLEGLIICESFILTSILFGHISVCPIQVVAAFPVSGRTERVKGADGAPGTHSSWACGPSGRHRRCPARDVFLTRPQRWSIASTVGSCECICCAPQAQSGCWASQQRGVPPVGGVHTNSGRWLAQSRGGGRSWTTLAGGASAERACSLKRMRTDYCPLVSQQTAPLPE